MRVIEALNDSELLDNCISQLYLQPEMANNLRAIVRMKVKDAQSKF